MEKSKVYFTKSITPESVINIYDALGITLKGNVAVKLHSGEQGNQNFIKPVFLKAIIEHVGGTVVECNTAYSGARNSTDKHKKLMEDHGWTKYFDVDIMDAEGPDMILPIKNGKRIKENYVGKNLKNYDSMLVLSHFKGHPMGATAVHSSSFQSVLPLQQVSAGFTVSEKRSVRMRSGRLRLITMNF